jgi:hypothetical protein
MIRTISSLLLALTLALAPVAPVLAQDSAALTIAPPVFESTNPYAQGLKDAKKAYEESYQRYRVAAQQAYWSWHHYQAYVRAYYEVYSAYSRYVWYQRAYEWHEAQGIRFSGRVLDGFSPLANATVTLTTYAPPYSRIAIRLIGTRTTDSLGRFEFTGQSEGRFSYSATKPGYSTASGTIEFKKGTNRLDIRINRLRGISGVVLARPLYGILPADPPAGFFDPRPLAGAKVTIFRTDVMYIQPYPNIQRPGPVFTAITGADGRFDFPTSDIRSASVTIEKASYDTHSENVDLSNGPADLRVVMNYNGPPPPIAQPAGPSSDDVHVTH